MNTKLTPAHLAPMACYICGGSKHAPTELHAYWPNADAARHFAALTDGPLPSMSAVETLDPREAVSA
jgi:hypothetical protein